MNENAMRNEYVFDSLKRNKKPERPAIRTKIKLIVDDIISTLSEILSIK
jgi:hypothetical protein